MKRRMERSCGVIAPRQHEMVGYRDDAYSAECILKANGHTVHVVRTPEGKFFAWQDDPDCECCEPDDPDHCYEFWKISKKRAIQLGTLI